MNLFRRPAPSLDDLLFDTPREDPSSECLMPTVARPPQVFVRGEGSWLSDSDDRAYLDFSQGGGANSLGHSSPVVLNALTAQMQTLINPGGGLYNRAQLNLADRLCHLTGSDQAYLLNSGAQACEAAIKLARKWGQLHRAGAHHIITASGGCHGHSFAAMAASAGAAGNRFEPQLPGFSHVPFNDLPALHAAVDAQTVAILLEPIQGTAGVIPATEHYLKGVERLCRELGILLILDEVQTGVGRCGSLLAEEQYGVRADIITLGKGLGSGVPLAALLARGKACCFEVGELEGTHHGNALMASAGVAVLDAVTENGFLQQIRESGLHLGEGLARLAYRYDHGQLRGNGLMWGLTLSDDSADAVVKAALHEGLILTAPQPDCLRFTPALNVSKNHIDEMLLRLARAFSRVRTAQLQCRKGIAV
ncbi:aminotransferase class III-fold pyridoxal phosphate-dependent enzyme [Pseudomonas tolaasii]|uniref:Aminotransferase class III-fold pyridoxal phosphate-dependent enzyme n=2 Tax=Pseudomonas tolaasii TaxID=29442 RepID=A0A7Y8DP91_PSETO|nr:aminotransferase class III-fold pyridoxal phosphate-dependent enzyme [Pseudomonas tolaasii]ARB30082.1 aspartate aminotransferase family protein [Pseudomonas tolaasii]KAB0476784.1 aminotransferase class III-fold pyridoxal phosphate-dependent enzyme [Pseudomonas tolaasii]MBW1245724.1 aminotransferase class III-fold pyridoxal phosphate-dependent enzyme [Pseudomonas tolaasii]MBY8938495.1 aminotransferase class III-fold pyridoxal phosphate-dependent enzyme [Pseudomonas tolaasii]NWC20856.1 aminot